MSRSFRTEPKRRIAARNANRNENGRVVLPRIVERLPRIGDVHPISKSKLAQMLSRLPVELYYGLRLIELRSRQNPVGSPFGEYSLSDKTIRLYSLPLTIHLPSISARQRRLMEVCEATIEKRADGFTISWPDAFSMGFWFYHDVFLHELGHHHRFQYPSKTGRPRRTSEEESITHNYCYWATVGRLSPKKYAHGK